MNTDTHQLDFCYPAFSLSHAQEIARDVYDDFRKDTLGLKLFSDVGCHTNLCHELRGNPLSV